MLSFYGFIVFSVHWLHSLYTKFFNVVKNPGSFLRVRLIFWHQVTDEAVACL
jgi:hypothetical protein